MREADPVECVGASVGESTWSLSCYSRQYLTCQRRARDLLVPRE
jgi:hypothetical protein